MRVKFYVKIQSEFQMTSTYIINKCNKIILFYAKIYNTLNVIYSLLYEYNTKLYKISFQPTVIGLVWSYKHIYNNIPYSNFYTILLECFVDFDEICK